MQAPPQSARAAAQLGAGPERKKPTVALRWHYILSYRLRAYFPRLLVLEVGRASIVYSGRLALSDEELRIARECDMAATAEADVSIRIISIGQVNAGSPACRTQSPGKSRGAVGPLPATSSAKKYLIDVEGHSTRVARRDARFRQERGDGVGADCVPTSSCGSRARRSRHAAPIAKGSMIFARGPMPSLHGVLRPFFWRSHMWTSSDPRWSGRPHMTSSHRQGRRREPSAPPWMLSLVRSTCP
jgi:hypothetical protein